MWAGGPQKIKAKGRRHGKKRNASFFLQNRDIPRYLREQTPRSLERLHLSYWLFMCLTPFLAQVETWVLLILAPLSLAQGWAKGRLGGNVHESEHLLREGRGWNILCLSSRASQSKGKEQSPAQNAANT